MKIWAKRFTHLASIIYQIPRVFNYFLKLTANLLAESAINHYSLKEKKIVILNFERVT